MAAAGGSWKGGSFVNASSAGGRRGLAPLSPDQNMARARVYRALRDSGISSDLARSLSTQANYEQSRRINTLTRQQLAATAGSEARTTLTIAAFRAGVR